MGQGDLHKRFPNSFDENDVPYPVFALEDKMNDTQSIEQLEARIKALETQVGGLTAKMGQVIALLEQFQVALQRACSTDLP